MRRYGQLMGIQIGDIATWASAVVALGGSAFAVWESRKSRKSNDKWQQINAEAAVRSANAAEQALALQQASLPPIDPATKPDVAWDLERPGKTRFVLRNIGTDIATGVTIDPEQFKGFARQLPTNAAVRPGASVEFLVFTAMGAPLPNEVWVSWDGIDEPIAIPIPSWY